MTLTVTQWARLASAISTFEIARPNATQVVGGWTPIGAATLHAATSDQSDATFIESTPGAAPDACELHFAAMGTPAAGDITFTFRVRSA